jgi:hypothetical protein
VRGFEDACYVAARPTQTDDQVVPDRFAAACEHDRDRRGHGRLARKCRRGVRDDHVHRLASKSRERGRRNASYQSADPIRLFGDGHHIAGWTMPLSILRAGTVGRRMKVGGVRTVGPSTVRVPGGTSCSSQLLRLPIRQSCERSCLSQSRGPGMSCAHRSMNAGQSAEKPFAPKRGETKIALNYHQQRRASVADETSTKRSCAFEGGSTSV